MADCESNALSMEKETTVNSSSSWKIALVSVVAVVGVVALAGHGPEHGFEASMPRMLLSDNKIFTLAKNARVKYSSLSGHHQRKLFLQFQEDYARVYKGNAEEKARLNKFKDFLELIDERNAAEAAAGTDGLHGITKFADLSQEEFEAAHLGNFKMIQEKNLIDAGAVVGDFVDVEKRTGDEAKDWTEMYTTSVNDQGACGASWAFASVEQIESDAMRAGVLERSKLMAKLSYQQAISCYTENGQLGCNGGYNWYTYENVASTGGISLQQNYPYVSGTTGEAETCNKATSVTSTVSVTQGRYYYNQEIKMQQFLLTTGPLTAHVSAKTWNTYVSGTMSTAGCSDWVDYSAWHAVQITGIDLGNGHYKVRNSWGTDWGEDGYIYLQTTVDANSNTCGVASFNTYAEVAAAKTKSMKSSGKSSSKKSGK